MNEIIVFWGPGTGEKKYKVKVRDKFTGKIRTIQFGDKKYGQYKDSTKLQLYKYTDHGDKERRESYFMRHSGVKEKYAALKKEMEDTKGYYTAKILSHRYLW